MRIILWLIAALVALYTGYWFVASHGLRSGTETALAKMRAAGTGDYRALDIGGFPYRFDVTVTAPEVTSPDGEVTWSAPDIRLYALSYQPQHVIAVLPPNQTLRLGRQTIAITAADLTASATVGLSSDLPLSHAESVGHTLAITSDFGWGLLADEARAAVRRAGAGAGQQLGIEMTGLTLKGIPADLVTTGGMLPERGERFYLDATLTLDSPLDLFTPVDGIRIRGADIRSLAIDWGPTGLSGNGSLTLDADGVPAGRIDLSLRNWRATLKLATALGLIRAETAPTVERALQGLALLGGDDATLNLPLVFQSGRMSLGPVPLGPAPRF